MIDFRDQAAALQPELASLRRSLHRQPEVGLQLPLTQATVLTALEGLGLEITTGRATTSVVAVLRGARPGPTVLLRGDMDALPLTELTGLEYASLNGAMHACGHDLHTAGLVGAARLLAGVRDQLAGNVIFMFQPGEEGYGGAAIMIDEGLLEITGELPVAAYAIHVGTGPRGVFSTRVGAVLAGSNSLRITVNGLGGHGSRPNDAIDPVPALAEIVSGLYAMVTRTFDVFDPVVLTVTQLQTDSAINVIPAQASLGATIRTLSRRSTELVEARSTELAQHVAAAHGCTATIDFQVGYPVTITDEAITEQAVDDLRTLFGDERVAISPNPRMASEDFSFVLDKVPGAFFMLGASPDGVDPTMSSNHSPTVQFDDSVLGDQAAALAALACRHLAG